MFYSQFILAKKGPLGTIWIAAHLERKLRKNQVTETNIGVSVDSILFPEVPIALRLSGHLLLGVVRIYSRKVNYLFHDCSEALVKIKQAFHSGAVDLPPEAATAPFHSITLPENFDFDDLELLPDREALFLANSSVDHHVTSREQITLQDTVDDSTYLSNQFGLDERLDAPRLELDEDVLPAKIDENPEEDPVLEEDPLPAVEDNDDLMEDEERHKDVSLGNIEERMLDVPDLNEEQPPEAEPEAPQQADTNNEALDINVVPELPSSSTPCEGGENPQGAAAAPEAELSEPQETQEAGATEETGAHAAEQAGLATEPHTEETDKDTAVEQTEKDSDKTQPALDGDAEAKSIEEQLEDVPEVEKLRSAVDAPEPENNLFELGIPESALKLADENEQQTFEEDASRILEAQETPLLKEDIQSSALRPSPLTMDSVGDDDVLASILGRRSLKVAPTPELPPAKRQKPGPKPGSKKRKAQVDEATVLHADDMRQQLQDTGDIRRIRKRAPCNDYEIWNSEKEVQGQQIFDEPLVLGFCENIRQIYRCIYSVGDAKATVESETTEVSAKHKHQLDCVESGEAITLADELLDDYDLFDSQRMYRFDEELEEQSLAELRECRGGKSTIPAAKQGEAAVEEIEQENAPQPDEQQQETKEAAPADEEERVDPPPADEQVSGTVEAPASEKAESTVCNPSPENTSSEHASTGEKPEVEAEVKEAAADEPETIEEPQPEAMEVDAAETSERVEAEPEQIVPVPADEENTMEHEEVLPNPDSAAAAIVEVGEDVSVVQAEKPASEEQEDPAAEQHQELVFLTDAKDEEGDDADEYDADYPDPHVQDNSGWSVRTRAVCQYLQTTFESMEQSRREKSGGAAKLDLDRLLQGKTRRESARMFFESLVLKTKDYVNVEQSVPFGNIYISARAKLMKADL